LCHRTRQIELGTGIFMLCQVDRFLIDDASTAWSILELIVMTLITENKQVLTAQVDFQDTVTVLDPINHLELLAVCTASVS
jgi:hypothetical protein